MSTPYVRTRRLDNQIGIQLDQADVLAIVCPAAAGTKNAPAAYTRKQDLISTFTDGPGVELGAWLLDTGQVGQVVMVRTDVTTVGGYGTIDVTGVTGTSVATTHAAVEPYDEYDVVVTVANGGTIGVAGITYTYSLDGGRTTSLAQALGTAVFAVLPGNVRINFAAGTLITGDIIRVRTTMPKWDGTQLAASLLTLQTTGLRWNVAAILGPCSAADAATIETSASAMEVAERERHFIYAVRNPNIGESESTYLTSLTSSFSSTTAPRSSICAGDCYIQSPISQRRYRRPSLWAIVGRVISIDIAQDPAAFEDGPLPTSVQIRDANGNVDRHDEDVNPGLDDQRFATLRTWKDESGTSGVYVNNCPVFSAVGSDYKYVQHARVMNRACSMIRSKLRFASSKKIPVAKTTGRIREAEAISIENSVNRALTVDLVDPTRASDATFTLSRTDNLLSTFKLKGTGKITPCGYPKAIEVDVGFFNPANNAVAV